LNWQSSYLHHHGIASMCHNAQHQWPFLYRWMRLPLEHITGRKFGHKGIIVALLLNIISTVLSKEYFMKYLLFYLKIFNWAY
jgi:hypothetical protein